MGFPPVQGIHVSGPVWSNPPLFGSGGLKLDATHGEATGGALSAGSVSNMQPLMQHGAGGVLGVLIMVPFMLVGWLATTVSMSLIRRSFPDEQRGVVNAISVAFEIPPPGIPAPSRLQPVWSASPMRQVDPNCKFVDLGLDQVFPSFQREYQDTDDLMQIGQLENG